MVCSTSCLVAVVFALSTVLFPLLLDKAFVKGYKNELPVAAQKALKVATAERSVLAFQGLVLGLIFGAILVLLSGKMARMASVCVLAASAFVIQFLYYMLSPKSTWVVKHLHTPEEREGWVRMYRHYQKAYYGSLALGVAAAGLLGYGICK
jgi:hypothetical protein